MRIMAIKFMRLQIRLSADLIYLFQDCKMIKTCLAANQFQINQKRKRKYHSRDLYTGSRGKWSDLENVAYFKFILSHCRDFERPGERKRNQVFLKMSRLLGTRTPDQCRSHHQKVENYAKTKQVSGICEFLLDKLAYSSHYKQLKSLYDQERYQLLISEEAEGFQKIKQNNYCILGNDRGCYTFLLDIQAIDLW